jgi:hypothetical protein
MGGITDALFGTSESPKITQQSTLTGGQRNLLDQLTQLLGGQKLQSATAPFSGDLSTGPTANQQAVFDQVSKLLSGGSTSQGIATGSLDTAMQAINKMLGGQTAVAPVSDPGQITAPEFNPQDTLDWWGKAVVDPAMQTWKQKVAPEISEFFISQNAGSSSGQKGALASSGKDLMTDLTGILSDRLAAERSEATGRGFEADIANVMNRLTGQESYADRVMRGSQTDQATGVNLINQLLGASETAGNVQSTELQNLLSMLGIGTAEQGIEQAGKEAEYRKFGDERTFLMNLLNTALGTGAVENVVQGGTQTQGLMGDLLGAGGQFLGSYPGANLIANLFK